MRRAVEVACSSITGLANGLTGTAAAVGQMADGDT
jgi:hypothetical protein